LMTIALAAAISASPAPAAAGGDEAYDVSISRADAKKLVEAIAAAPSVGETAADGGPITLNVKKNEDGPPPGTQNFAGLNFGIGISATYDLGKNDRVSEATLVGGPPGIVRVTNQDNVRARIMLESHYFFTPPDARAFGAFGPKNPSAAQIKGDGAAPEPAKWGIGPFVALQPGTENIIEAIGMGLMVGFRRGDSGDSFNIGVGVAFDPNTRTLGEGIVAGQPLPPGETDIRYLEQEQFGLLFLSSYSF
ncbi:MAG: hypothetical protein HXY21_00555, partial [Parvularculaceae bacterium]|nr:hypothetical protein [Parvularculaceae bacterium]